MSTATARGPDHGSDRQMDAVVQTGRAHGLPRTGACKQLHRRKMLTRRYEGPPQAFPSSFKNKRRRTRHTLRAGNGIAANPHCPDVLEPTSRLLHQPREHPASSRRDARTFSLSTLLWWFRYTRHTRQNLISLFLKSRSASCQRTAGEQVPVS